MSDYQRPMMLFNVSPVKKNKNIWHQNPHVGIILYTL